MGLDVRTLALLSLLVLAAVDAHHKHGQASRHGGRARAAHHGASRARASRQRGREDRPLVTVRETNIFRYDFGDDGTLEEELRASGHYDPKMVIPYDVTMDDYQRNRIFVTTPLMRRGIPATLCTIAIDAADTAGHSPYPNLGAHHTTEDTITDCDTQLVDIFSTTKTWGDDDTLYAMDNGVLDLSTSPKNVCPPKIVVFNLLTDEITSTTEIQNAACNSMYTYLVVDSCPDGSLTAYSSDTKGNVLTVTDLSSGVSKHLQSQYFHPKPGSFFIMAGGPSYYMPHGLCGLTAEQKCDGKVYFQALASNIQGAVDKQVLRNASDGDVLDIKTQVDLPGALSGPSGDMVVYPTGELLFFPVLDKVALYCWNTSKPHNAESFRMLAQDSELLEYMSSVTVQTQTRRLYIVSNRFTYYLSNTTNYAEQNYRLLYIDIEDIEC